MRQLIEQLNSEPALAWKVTVNVLGQAPDSSAAQKAAKITRCSPLATQLLEGRVSRGDAYRKWTGSHWTLSLLADLAPELVHPVLGRSISRLVAGLDTTGVKRYEQPG